MLTKRERELDRRRQRSGRTVLALHCVSCQMKISESLANWSIFVAPGNHHYCSAGIFWVDLDRDVPEEEFAGVEWCSDAFVSLLEELKIVFSPILLKTVWRRSSLDPKKPTSLHGNRNGARLYFLLSSTFLWCCNFQISALERTLSGCLLSISFDFTPFPVKVISAQTGIRPSTCRRISSNGKITDIRAENQPATFNGGCIYDVLPFCRSNNSKKKKRKLHFLVLFSFLLKSESSIS